MHISLPGPGDLLSEGFEGIGGGPDPGPSWNIQ